MLGCQPEPTGAGMWHRAPRAAHCSLGWMRLAALVAASEAICPQEPGSSDHLSLLLVQHATRTQEKEQSGACNPQGVPRSCLRVPHVLKSSWPQHGAPSSSSPAPIPSPSATGEATWSTRARCWAGSAYKNLARCRKVQPLGESKSPRSTH